MTSELVHPVATEFGTARLPNVSDVSKSSLRTRVDWNASNASGGIGRFLPFRPLPDMNFVVRLIDPPSDDETQTPRCWDFDDNSALTAMPSFTPHIHSSGSWIGNLFGCSSIATPDYYGLFQQLNQFAETSDEEWLELDFDPLTKSATARATELLTLLSIGQLGLLGWASIRNVEMHAGRSGGLVIIVSTPVQEIEFAINPTGSIEFVVVDPFETDYARRYIEEGEIDPGILLPEIGRLLR